MDIANVLLLTVAFVALIIGSVTDFKKREVPDYVSFSLIAAALGFRLCYSILSSNWSYIVNGLAGFSLFLVLAYVMFYAGQWGGGDSKILMGLGAVIGFDVYNISMFYDSMLIGFIINALMAGAIFGILFAIYLAIRNFKTFKPEFLRITMHRKSRQAALILAGFLFVFAAAAFFYPDMLVKAAFAFLAVLTLPILYLIFFIKAVENTCMMRYVSPMELTEGDWIVKDVSLNGKRICGPKDLGIEKAQIDILVKAYKKGRIKKILIKEGVPFVPSFFIALIITLVYGNWIIGLVR